MLRLPTGTITSARPVLPGALSSCRNFAPFSAYVPMLVSEVAGAPASCLIPNGRTDMSESVYKVIELVGTSKDSWEKAAAAAVERAKTLRDLRVAEIVKL